MNNKNQIWDMDFSTDFTRMVDEDIKKCDDILNGSFDEKKWKELHVELTAKYSAHISNIGSDMYGYIAQGNFFDVNLVGQEGLKHNLFVLKNKLIAFKNFGYKNRKPISSEKGINIQNTLSASQTTTINISFEEVKRQIENMTGLSESETNETLQKIDEIKAIVELQEPKKSKWQKPSQYLSGWQIRAWMLELLYCLWYLRLVSKVNLMIIG